MSTLWPLVKRVDVVGNYPQVPKGVVLVDLPGLNDPNAARVEVTREYLRSAPYVWVVFNMVRGMTKDIHSVLIDEKVLRDLLMYGNYHSLALIGTQADQIQPGMGRRLGLPAGSSDSVLVNTYREQSILKARQNLANMVRTSPRPAWKRPRSPPWSNAPNRCRSTWFLPWRIVS